MSVDTENIVLDKISLDTTDFGDGLDSNFGIQDTKTLASNELNNFLMGVDPDKITKVDKKEDTPNTEVKPNSNTTTSSTNSDDKTDLQKAEEKALEGKTALEEALFSTKEERETTKESSQSTQTKTTDNSTSDNSTSDDDTYNTLAKDFLRLGVFSPDDDDETEDTIDIKTPEEFLERSRAEQKKGAVSILDNFLSQFGEDYRKAFDAIFVNGINPQEYLNTFSKIQSIENMDLVNENNQKRVLREYYKGLKWDDNKIENKIEKLKDYGELEDEARSYHEVLLNKEKENEEKLIQTKTQENNDKKLKEQSINQSYHRILQEKLKVKEIDGIPLNANEAQDILNYLANKPYKLESGELLSEFDKDILDLNRPENHEQKIKLALLLRKKLDLTSVKKTAVSKKSDELFTLSTKNAKKADVTTRTSNSFFS